MKILPGVCAVGVFGWATTLSAAEADPAAAAARLGEVLPLWSCLPFAGILLSIALVPLARAHVLAPPLRQGLGVLGGGARGAVRAVYGGAALHEIVHIVIVDYVPFIILLWSPCSPSAGGILLRGSLRGHAGRQHGPAGDRHRLASWIGTTGAAMLLIRPLLRANARRKHRAHTVVFFIFLVGNIGGSPDAARRPAAVPRVPARRAVLLDLQAPARDMARAGRAAPGRLLRPGHLLLAAGRTPRAARPTAPREPLKLEGGHNFALPRRDRGRRSC